MACALLVLLTLAPNSEKVDFGTSTARRVKLLRHKHPRVRRQAAMLLAHAPADEAIAGLLLALSDNVGAVRRAAAASLAELGDERAVPFLADRLGKERDSRALAALLVAVARTGESYVARHVQPFLNHPVRNVRAAAAVALGHVGDAGQRGALWAALRFAPDDPGFVVRSSVLGAFLQLGWIDDARRAIEELEAAGALRHWASRVALVAAVGPAGMKERAAWLKKEFRNPDDPRVVAAAASSLAMLGHRDAVVTALGHEAAIVRRAALVALQEQGDPRAVARARVMVREDKDANVRFEAALVLHHAGSDLADRYLVDALRSRDPLIWITALGALETRHGRSFGRDPDAWTKHLDTSRR